MDELQAQLREIQDRARAARIRVTVHAHERMVEQGISLDDVFEAIAAGRILEDYAEHRRGACCLVGGSTRQSRPLHVVCTTAQPVLIIITVYEPTPPKWVTPTERGGRHDEV